MTSPACGGDGGGDGTSTLSGTTFTTTTTGAETGSTGDGDGDSTSTTSGDGDGDSTTTSGDGDGDFSAVLFLNFDGVTLGGDGDSSVDDVSQIYPGETLLPFDTAGTDAHLFVAQAVADDLSAYSVQVVIERPTSGDYTMLVVSPTNPAGGNTSGIGPSDCNNVNPNNVGFAFLAADDSNSPEQRAATILLIWGFTLGLEQVVISSDIMAEMRATPNPSFQDMCIDLAATPGSCAAQHAMQCDAGLQNSHAELMAMFGPAN